MVTAQLVLLVIAWVLFVLAACNAPSKYNLTAAGLAFAVASFIPPFVQALSK